MNNNIIIGNIKFYFQHGGGPILHNVIKDYCLPLMIGFAKEILQGLNDVDFMFVTWLWCNFLQTVKISISHKIDLKKEIWCYIIYDCECAIVHFGREYLETDFSSSLICAFQTKRCENYNLFHLTFIPPAYSSHLFILNCIVPSIVLSNAIPHDVFTKDARAQKCACLLIIVRRVEIVGWPIVLLQNPWVILS